MQALLKLCFRVGGEFVTRGKMGTSWGEGKYCFTEIISSVVHFFLKNA